jgi:hypothetical protein
MRRRQRQAVDEQDDVGPEVVLAVLERHFGDDVEAVVVELVEVDQTQAGAGRQTLVEGLAEIFVLQVEMNVVKEPTDIAALESRIDTGDGGLEDPGKDVVASVPVGGFQRHVLIAEPGQVQQSWNLDAGIFVECTHADGPIHAGMSR